MNSKVQALIAAQAALDKKAEDVSVVEVRDLLVVTDYFVIATALNDRQVRAVIDEVEDRVRIVGGVKPIGREGLDEGRWALLDYGDFVVHVFQPEPRDFYRLETLWGDAPVIEVPEEEIVASTSEVMESAE